VKTFWHPFLLQHENSSLPVGSLFESKFEEDDDTAGCSFVVTSTFDTKLQFSWWATGKLEYKLLSSAIIETRKKTIFTCSNLEKLQDFKC
jgi:hypothetical protein